MTLDLSLFFLHDIGSSEKHSNQSVVVTTICHNEIYILGNNKYLNMTYLINYSKVH